jgi:hypothetical protein
MKTPVSGPLVCRTEDVLALVVGQPCHRKRSHRTNLARTDPSRLRGDTMSLGARGLVVRKPGFPWTIIRWTRPLINRKLNEVGAAELSELGPSAGQLEPSRFVLSLGRVGREAAVRGEAKTLFGCLERWH